MKVSNVSGSWGVVYGFLLAGMFLAGCHGGADKRFAEVPGLAGPGPGGGVTATGPTTALAAPANTQGIDRIIVGDTLTVTFADLPTPQPPIEERVREDGTIMLLQNLRFKAAGKSRGDLEKEIREAYVPKYFVTATVTVTPKRDTQFYYVGGEVKKPDRQVYLARLTVTKAIDSAGGFTDFARKRAIQLTRVDGRTITINFYKALKDPSLDPEVYPGDKIHVPRRGILW